jgi:ornithine cyclodeaminase
MTQLLDAAATRQVLPAGRLVQALEHVLRDGAVQAPERLMQPLPGGGTLFLMPACDERLAIAKLITYTPSNTGGVLPAIQGDVVVFDVATGSRLLVLDGPEVTARRTACVSLLAAQRLAPNTDGPLLIVGAGAQGLAHLEAFADGLPARHVFVASRTRASAERLVERARSLELSAEVVDDPASRLADCPLIVTCTPATQVVLAGQVRDDAFIAAVGSFTPRMAELDAALCRDAAARGRIVLDTAHARHEAGDILQAGIDVATLPTLADVVCGGHEKPRGPVLFKSCGWAGWDLAAARCAMDAQDQP